MVKKCAKKMPKFTFVDARPTLAVCGPKTLRDYKTVARKIDFLRRIGLRVGKLVTRGATIGTDKHVRRYAMEHDLQLVVVRGVPALVGQAQWLLALWDTKDERPVWPAVNQAQATGVPFNVEVV